MHLIYRTGTIDDLTAIKELALRSWTQFQPELTDENWKKLVANLGSDTTYIDLFQKSTCFLCSANEKLAGMVFLVPSGHPTDLFQNDWSTIRLLSVDPAFRGQGIGRQLTINCLEWARQSGETTIALHTSEIMGNARYIYEELGFTILKEIEPRLGKRYWLYTLDLTKHIKP